MSVSAAAQSTPFTKLPVPEDAEVSTFGAAALIELRSSWSPIAGGAEFAAGALLALPMEHLVEANYQQLTVLFEPSERSSLEAKCGTLNYLAMVVLQNVNATLRCQAQAPPFLSFSSSTILPSSSSPPLLSSLPSSPSPLYPFLFSFSSSTPPPLRCQAQRLIAV